MKLIFVYNADSGVLNTVKDIGQKLLSPQSYNCFLCSLTHGTFRENPDWKKFREDASTEMEFLHRNEFQKEHEAEIDYPCIIKQTDTMEVVVSKEQLGNFAALEDLIHAVKNIEAGS